ncbi:MAG: hypothetical protein ABIP11_01435 [Luteimonas sp.]
MNATDPTSLTPQERELARQLAQIATRSEPSPALDARILAAAREAGVRPSSIATAPTASFSKSKSRPGRIRRPWPVVLGVAASMVLALGVAWRMQPLPEARQARSSDAAPVMRAATTSPQVAIEPPVESQADSTPPKAQSQAEITSHARAISSQADESAAASPAAAEPPIVLDAPSPQDARPAAAKAAAPPGMRPPAPQVSGTMAAPAAVPPPPSAPNTASQADMAADSRQNPAQQANSKPTKSTAGDHAAPRDDEPLNDVPPATADAPAVRDAWLQRTRTLLDDGDLIDARLSLDAFIRRYPAYPLPEDLKALARDSAKPP